MDYSVIIRTKNSEKTIQKCLESIKKQSIKPKEIFLVDSGSIDLTLEKTNKFRVNIILYPQDDEFNYSKAINIGIRETSSEYILILSSHTEFLNENSVEWMYEVLKTNDKCITVSMGRTDNESLETFNEIKKIEKRKIIIENFEGQAMYNFCSLIRKTSWEEYNFNENIPSCEDQEWSFNFLKKGFFTEIILNPRIYYNNPYYNLKKDAWDTITLGQTVYPYFLSKKYMMKLFMECINKYLSGNKVKAKLNLYIFWNIFRYKYLGKFKIKSIYHENLK